MGIDAKTLYWTAALANMVVIVGCAAVAVRRVRRGDVQAHRRLMKLCAWLVLGFLVSYVAKALVLGRERLELWEPGYVLTLRFHETCIAVMLLAGSRALYLAWRTRFGADQRPPGEDPLWLARRRRLHRLAGRAAICAAALGVVAACVVLWGMYARM